MMHNIYTVRGHSKEADKLHQSMKEQGRESWIEVGSVIHKFRMSERLHPEIEQMVKQNEDLHERLG